GSIGSRVFKIRKFLELSQEAFGKEIGMTRSAISKIEKGENALTDKNIKLICKIFGISEKWLRTGEGSMRGEEQNFITVIANSLGEIDEEDMRIVKAYLTLDEEYRIAFRTFLDGFLKNKK